MHILVFKFGNIMFTKNEPSAEPWAWTKKGTFEARRLLAARFAMSEDEMRLRALRKIRTVLLFYPEDSALGKNLLSSAGTLVEESKLTKIIEDSFAGRAAGTLIKRATDFTKFATWLVARRGRPLAPGEQALYDYVSHLRSSESSPTSADSFIKAYKFMMHLSGAMPNPSVSARVEGVSKSMASRKRPLWQAPELPVVGVSAVESYVLDSQDLFKVVVGGFILFCLFSSSRWSDAARATGLVLDTSSNGLILLETSTKHYKTKAKDRKDAVLPLIALGNGLQRPAWGLRWLKVREQLGLENASCLMPAVTGAGTFLDRAMTAAEGTLWLREILYVQGVPENLELYSSHSLKATALSWTAKSCTMTYEERLTQGHRCSPKHGMALLYSRDALAEILTKVARVVRAIQKGDFEPDLPRAERVARALCEDPKKFQHLPETVPEDLPDDEPTQENVSEDGSDASDIADLLGPEVPAPPADVRPRVSKQLLGQCYVHVLSGISHCAAGGDLLKCGRKVTVNMRPLGPDEPQLNVCQQCASAA